MTELTLEAINSIVSSPFAYLILFIGLLSFVLRSSQIREEQMREQLNRTIPVLDKILMRLDLIEEKLER